MSRSKVGYVDDIEKVTKKNKNFREVLWTGGQMQLVVMKLKEGEEIGSEVHNDIDQFFRVEEGEGVVVMDGEVTKVKDDDAIIVPAGVEHNVANTGKKDLKLYTIYTPPEHPDGTVHKDKKEADTYEEEHHH